MNYIHIAGHLGADPETRFTATGLKVTSFRIATNSRKGGKEETIWYRITVWGDRFDKMLAHLKKGSAVIVVGELRPEIYIDKEGRPQLSLDVTADLIRFSPFGRSERSGQDQAQGSDSLPYQSSNMKGSGEQSFGFQQGSSQESSFAQPGAFSYSAEEPLPF